MQPKSSCTGQIGLEGRWSLALKHRTPRDRVRRAGRPRAHIERTTGSAHQLIASVIAAAAPPQHSRLCSRRLPACMREFRVSAPQLIASQFPLVVREQAPAESVGRVLVSGKCNYTTSTSALVYRQHQHTLSLLMLRRCPERGHRSISDCANSRMTHAVFQSLKTTDRKITDLILT